MELKNKKEQLLRSSQRFKEDCENVDSGNLR
jgi:hypothetical protein